MSKKVVCIIFLACFVTNCCGKRVHRLEKLNIDPNQITISGFSSGGAQAMQFHISHSSKLMGVGIFAGVPYMYGHDRKREDFFVTNPDQFNISIATEYARKYEESGLIDPLEHLQNSRVYIYHGSQDKTVYHGCGAAIEKIYSTLSPNTTYRLDSLPADHGMPSDNSGGQCGTVNLLNYLVNNCNYSGVYEMFNFLYGGDLAKPNGTVGTVPLQGQLVSFDQSEFMEKLDLLSKSESMDNQGYIYIPSRCQGQEEGKKCKFSIALHGCAQTRQTYGDKFARTTGYLEVAELNDIIILFPQTKRSMYSPRNPSGCWDWMGFTGENYGNKNGLQVKALNKMLDRVLGTDDN